ncbi:MAG TPA: CPBP family intramembrane glutamic endopeptidase [Terriglobales bacterium]|nr:CPBP family intramembrane glutamic endopeptidase [Terriglobales bacterium]
MSTPVNPLPDSAPELSPAIADQALNPIIEPALPPTEKRFPAWSGWDVLAIAVFGVFCLLVLIVVAVLATGVLSGQKSLSIDDVAHNPIVIRASLGGQAAAYLLLLLCIFVVVRSRAGQPFGRALQWNWPGASAAAFLAAGIVLAVVVDYLSRFLPLPKSLPIEDMFSNRANAYLMAVFGVTLAPLLEELFFRGLLYPVLRRGMGLVMAVLLTAVGFAGIHSVQLGYAWAPILSIFVVGVIFTLVRERWSSVASSFLMHCGYNLTLFALIWYATGHFQHLEKAAG